MWLHLLQVREKLNFTTYKDEHDTYLHMDVCHLADVFEYFRKTCYQRYGIDPAWCVSLPGYSWACMKKNISDNDITVKLITDIDMFLMVEKSFRGGITVANKRLCKKPDDDPNIHILYIDANNLYGWAMIQKLGEEAVRSRASGAVSTSLTKLEDAEGFNAFKIAPIASS